MLINLKCLVFKVVKVRDFFKRKADNSITSLWIR